MEKKYLIKKYLVRNEKELIYLTEKIEVFNREYKIIGNGRMITELGKEGHVNMHPQHESSKIEKIISRKNKSETIWKSTDRSVVKVLTINQVEYYISNNPEHYSR